MSNVLRNPWLTTFARKKLADGIAQRDGRTVELGQALDTIGPLGELRFAGDRFKLLQVVQFISYDDPVTAVLSDKSVRMTCKFSSTSKMVYEASNGHISGMKGGIIKPTSYQIHFIGVDGKLFWKGVTHEDQISGELASRKTGNRTKQTLRNNGGSSESVAANSQAGNTRANFPTPEPVLYIDTFTFHGSEGSAVWGSPTSISLKANVKNLLENLPRKKYTEKETPVGFGRGCQPMNTMAKSPLQGKAKIRAKGQGGGNTARETSRKNTLPKLLRQPKNVYDSDDEIHSQPEINGVEEESQLAFATQAPARFSSTYDDLEFYTQADQGKEERAEVAPSSARPISKSSQSTGHSPQVVIITKAQRRGDPRQIKASAKNEKKHSGKPKLINYSDGTGFGGSTASPAANKRSSKKMSIAQHKREPGRRSSSLSDSSLIDAEAEGEEASRKGSSWGWQDMINVTKEDTVIPKNQQELLDRPESWYPHQTNQNRNTKYTSGYSLVPKVQPIPKSHSPRDRSMPLPAKFNVPTPHQSSPTSSSEDEEIPWPPSPARPPRRDINAMPPDSSAPSSSQFHHAGRWGVDNLRDKNTRSTQGTSTENSSSTPQQGLTPLEAGFGRKSSPVESPPGTPDHSEKEEISGDVAVDKRVTRAANGISKKVPVDPNNVEPSRMAKANLKLKTSIARKRLRPEYESEEASEEPESPEDKLINDPYVPFEVMDPYGRTRVAVFGGILKAQQVQMWRQQQRDSILKAEQVQTEEQRRREHKSPNNEDEIQGGYDSYASDEDPIGEENGRRVDVLMEATQSIVESVAAGSNSANDEKQVLRNIQDTGDHTYSPRLPGSRNSLTKTATKTVSSGHHSKVVDPLFPSKPKNTTLGDRAPESTPGSSVELPVAKEDIDTDDENEIPQAPLIPLKIMADTRVKVSGILRRHSPFIDRLKNVPVKSRIIPSIKSQTGTNNSSQLIIQPKDNNPSATILSQTSFTSDIPCDQNSFKTPPPLPSSASNTAPTVQVEVTPYRNGSPGMRNSSLSPTTLRTRAILGYFHSESDDVTLIPGTSTGELRNSSASSHVLAARPPTPEQDSSPPEAQLISLDYVPSPTETGGRVVGFPDDSAMSKRQLQRGIQQRTAVEVPATAEMDDTRAQYAGTQPLPSRKLSKTRKLKRLIKSVDFQSQEIRTANAYDVSSMLENQKRQFLGLEDRYGFGGVDLQEDCPPTNEYLGKKLGVKAPESLANTSGIHGLPVPASPVRIYVSISSDDDNFVPNISQSNTRKRDQLASSDVPKPAKKSRIGGEPTHRTSHTPSSPVLASYHPTQDTVGTPTSPRNKSPRTTNTKPEDEDEGEIRPEPNNDLMASFPEIDSPIDTVLEPPWPSQIPSKPEIYAGIRERHLSVPGYENLTYKQKKELDKRRQEYFGVSTREGTKRLFSVQLQRAMQSVSSSSSLRKRAKYAVVAEPAEDDWYRDENTPLRKFYKGFRDLKQAEAKLE